MNISMNLRSDWVTIVRSELISYGYDVSSMDEATVAFTYSNLEKRLVSPVRRKVLKSREFTCPSELQSGLDILESKIVSGINLKFHLSRSLRSPDYDDALSNHWGIHHLHLGTEIEQDGFVSRTGPLLFAMFDEKNAYLISVAPHGSWSNQDLVQILHENWPKSIENFRILGDTAVGPISDPDIGELRKVNVNTFIQVKQGIVYGSIGGGSTLNGHSVEATLKSQSILKELKQMEENISSRFDSIKNEAEKVGAKFPDEPYFLLQYNAEGVLQIIEQNSQYVVYQLGSQNPIELRHSS